MNTKGIQMTTQKVGVFLNRNSPTILTGIGVAGLVTTTVMAVRATPKALQILYLDEEIRKNECLPDPTKLEIVKLTWKCYAPAVAMGSLTIVCIICANSVNLRRNAALASVYSLAETSLKEYKAKVVETIGNNKERKIKDELVKDKIKKNPVSTNEVISTGKGETLCYEVLSGRYFKSDIEKIRKSENILNKELLTGMYITLNDVFYELGLANTKLGDEIGWSNEDGMLAFDFNSQLSDTGEPCLVVDYVVDPRYDYMDAR